MAIRKPTLGTTDSTGFWTRRSTANQERPWPQLASARTESPFFSSKASEQTEEKASNQGLGWFGRIAFEPQNRNFVGLYFDTGLVYTGLIPPAIKTRLA